MREKGPGELPASQSFGGANGGEYRKSFHGYAPGFAQVGLINDGRMMTEYSVHGLDVYVDVLYIYIHTHVYTCNM